MAKSGRKNFTEEEKTITRFMYYISHENQRKIESGYEDSIARGFIKITIPKTELLSIDDVESVLKDEEGIERIMPYIEDLFITQNCPDLKLDIEITETTDILGNWKNAKACYSIYIKYRPKMAD